ncbi:M28 family peptidase [bacterium]|nr:M28 family peptidase [bacterium]
MRVRSKFIKLTSETYPHGTEKVLHKFLPKTYQIDSFGNFYVEVGEKYSTMFTCHLDTASHDKSKVTHVFDGDYIKTNGKTILGADDKAGMVVLLYMIENKVPGLYYFFLGEERGCIGSSAISKTFNHPNIKKCVSFDRRGTTSIITEQIGGVCCSDEFANDLASKLNDSGYGLKLSPDSTGLITDSMMFMDKIPECTNISVGYYDEHKKTERQDINYLARLCKSVVSIDWESLVVNRDPRERVYHVNKPIKTSKVESKKEEFASIELEEEASLIKAALNRMGYSVSRIWWDGIQCYADDNGYREHIGNRSQLSDFVPSLNRKYVSSY